MGGRESAGDFPGAVSETRNRHLLLYECDGKELGCKLPQEPLPELPLQVPLRDALFHGASRLLQRPGVFLSRRHLPDGGDPGQVVSGLDVAEFIQAGGRDERVAE